MPSVQLISRSQPSSGSSSTSLSSVYIAGIIVVIVIALGAAIWLSLHLYRKRAAAKRQSKMGAAFFSVKGLVPDKSMDEKSGPLQRSATLGNAFSRSNMDTSIVMPEKSLAAPGQTREEIIEYHRQSGLLPNSFAPKPFSFALGAGSPRISTLEPDGSSQSRNSWMSFSGSSQNRFSVMSGTSSIDPHSTTGSTRKVRQLFEPVLPDELLLMRPGEMLTVVQSFDDGWCVVGRENASFVHTAKSLFKSTPTPENNVELGVVPAWCFLKPVKGLRAERPMRSSSLGVTVKMDGPGYSSRDELTSWSNF